MATTYTFPAHIKGDTFQAINFTVIVNSVALDLTGAVIKMYLRNSENAILQKFTTDDVANPGLTITAPATGGKFSFDEQIIDVQAGTHKYDIEFELSDDTVETYVSGTWTITQDITYD